MTYLEDTAETFTEQELLEFGAQMRRAQMKVNIEIAAGRLVRQPCQECGAEPADGHHEDYYKPLEVQWLCRRHHNLRHPKHYKTLDTAKMGVTRK